MGVLGENPNYAAGGFSWSEDGEAGSFTGGLGRWLNNVSGTTAQNIFNAEEAEKARVYNSAEAAKDREFQEYMSNTAYQRAVADMKAAGINPAMANSQGGASTPGGAMATAKQANAVGSGNSSGLSGMIGRIAAVAIGKGLEAKFSHSAQVAADHHELITAKIAKMAHEEQLTAAKAQEAITKSKYLAHHNYRWEENRKPKFHRQKAGADEYVSNRELDALLRSLDA